MFKAIIICKALKYSVVPFGTCASAKASAKARAKAPIENRSNAEKNR